MSDKEEILNSMLLDVPNAYDKQPGSFIYDALAPVAAQLETTDGAVAEVKTKLSIENLSGDELAQRVQERTGITRRAATRAIGSVTVTGTGAIQVGDLFETSAGLQYRSTEAKEIPGSGAVAIEAVEPGARGIVPANTITLFPVTLAGFTAVNNPTPTQDGFDAESDVDLLQRYYDRIQTPATSGNRAHYKNWAKEVSGVGDARVIPIWDGPGTVKVVIIDSNRLPASVQVVQDVQDHIDPNSSGLGEGAAPIGATVTVASAGELAIDIAVQIVLSFGFTVQMAQQNITSSLTKYFREAAFVESIVSYAKVGAAILDSQGVEDYSGLTVNGATANVLIGNEQVAVLGSVTVNAP